MPGYRYAERRQQAAFYQQTLERVERLPGVESAGAIFPLVLTDRVSNRFSIEGRPPAGPGEQQAAYFRSISPNYFRAMGIQLIGGRAFTANDTAQSAPVMMINETLARRFWPNESAIGKRMTINVRFHTSQDVPREIIGVVADVKHAGLDAPAGPEMYTSYLQVPWPWMSLVVRTSVDPTSVAAAVTAQVRDLNKSVPLPPARTLEQMLSGSQAPRRFNMLLLAAFAVAALMLAAIGLYGVISFAVTQRTQELGIRVALGARTGDVLKLVIGQGMKLALLGVGIGLAGALALTRLLKTWLFGVSATDPLTFAAVALSLTTVALVACWIPARRATKVDPMIALRCE